ncbi:MAG: response regulator [Deltaproteobacteria bacterium]|nr:response regulator [Deltaproteobacteria bacterium]
MMNPNKKKNANQIKILLVDDLQDNLLALEGLLKRDDLAIFKAKSGTEALEFMMRDEFALALIDVQMPGMSGFELAELMRGAKKTRSIPIIFVTATDQDQGFLFKGYESGAVDFLLKPLDSHMVRSKANIFIEIYRQKRELENQLETITNMLEQLSQSSAKRETEFLISQILAVAPGTAKALPKVLQSIGENLGWAVGNFWMLDTDSHQIRCDQTWFSPSVKAPEFFAINQKPLLLQGVELPCEVWESGKPRWIIDLAQSPHFSRIPHAMKAGLKSAVAFPICLGKKMLGVMEFFSIESKSFDKELLQTFDTIGGQVGQFIVRKEAEERLQIIFEEMEMRVQERTAELLKSNKEILEITHTEQRCFGAQLHDGLCQDLAGIMMVMKSLTQKKERGKHLDVADLKKVSDLLNGAASQARDTARGLYPGELEGNSLMYMLEELTANQTLSGVSCRFYCPEPILISKNDVATHIYKIAQEGIVNAIKHGKAKEIDVSFIRNNGNIVLTIKDAGTGFVGDPQNAKGIGLKIMKNRAHIIGASFQVEPNIPHGVILTCILKNIP